MRGWRRTAAAMRGPDHVEALAALQSERVRLRTLEPSDRDEFLELVRTSRHLHRPWAYPPDRPDQFDELLAR